LLFFLRPTDHARTAVLAVGTHRQGKLHTRRISSAAIDQGHLGALGNEA
jgi:hypothetical protein